MADALALKISFNDAAEAYDTYRPHYPPALFAKLIADTHLDAQSRLLEIGPGTGQATEPLARHGYDITAIELGEHLAAKAHIKLERYRCVHILTGAFEETDLPEAYFDLVFSATAIHWIKPAYKYTKPHRILKPHGHLAIIHTEHISDGHGNAFHRASQPIYDRFMAGDSPAKKSSYTPLPAMDALKPPDIDASLFKLCSFTPFPLTITYTAEQYTGLIGTYSPTLALPAATRAAFLAALSDLIVSEFGGTVQRHFVMTLAIAQKI
jgi:protein-L-isoaspartate O-methyltransferase